MKKVLLSVLAIAAIVAVPVAGAQAKPPAYKVNKGKALGKAKAKAKAKGKARRCAKPQRVGFVVDGTFGSYTDPDLTVNVVEANKHAGGWVAANGSTFPMAGVAAAFEGVTDGNADGLVSFADLTSTDQVIIVGKLSRPKKGCTGSTSVVVRHVHVIRQ
jgi:hypothetical protein